jgi:outer membrane protein assembly factor BamB
MRSGWTGAVALAVVALAAGCGGGEGAPPETTPTQADPPPAPVAQQVAVVDGDTREPIAGATVTAFTAAGAQPPSTSDAQGRTPIPPGTTGTCASTPVYPQDCRTVVADRPLVTIPLYNPALQSPEYGGGPDRTRYVPAVDVPVPSGKAKWTHTGKVLLEFPPSVAAGAVALTTNRGRIVVFDAATGRERWNKRHPKRRYPEGSEANNIAASPAIITTSVENKQVLVSGMDGRLVSYNLANGRELWEFSTGQSPIESSPLVIDETAYVGAWNGRLYAVSTKTGKGRWDQDFQAAGDIKGSAAQAGNLIVVGDYAGNVYGIRASNGREAWRRAAGKRFYGGAAVSNGVAVIGDVGGAVVALDAKTGRQLWRHQTGAEVYSSPAIAKGTVFIGSYNGRFQALNLRTGAVKWTFAAGGRISGSATVVGDTVYTAVLARRGEKDRTYALNVANGKLRKEFDDGRYSPAVAAGKTLYLVGRTTLYAYSAP